MQMQLKRGRYKFSYKPCNNFQLLHGNSVYHSRDHKAGTECIVNVTKPGKYTSNRECVHNFIGEIPEAGNEIVIPEPERERIREVVIKYNPDLGMEGTPARIFTNMRPAVIELGPRFYTLPIQARVFILLHEYAHLFYATEWKVDALALKMFLQQGFNPSQAFYALSKVLNQENPDNLDRVTKLFNELKLNGYVN